MTAKLTHVLSIDASALGLVGVVRADIRLIRTSASDSFVSIPDNFRVQVDLIDGLGSVRLLENTYGSIYDCTLYAANSKKASQFFFNMPDADASLTDLGKLTAWPDSEDTSTVPTPTVGLVDLDDVDDSAAAGKFLTEVNPADGVRQFGFEQVSIDDVLGLPDALGNRSEVGHTHPFDTLTNQPTEYPPSAHYHYINETVDLPETISGLNAQDATLQANIDAEAAAREAGVVILNQALAMVGGGAKGYQTKVLMDAVTPTDPNLLSYVTNDLTAVDPLTGDPVNYNGLYGWTGSEWIKSVYDPLAQALLADSVIREYIDGFLTRSGFSGLSLLTPRRFVYANINEQGIGFRDFKIRSSADSSVKIVDRRGFIICDLIGQDKNKLRVAKNNRQGFNIVDSRGFVVFSSADLSKKYGEFGMSADNKITLLSSRRFVIGTVSLDSPTAPSGFTDISEPLFGGVICGFSDTDTTLNISALLHDRAYQRSTANVMASIGSVGTTNLNPYYKHGRDYLCFKTDKIGSSAEVVIVDTKNPDLVSRKQVVVATVPDGAGTTLTYLGLGDSITNRMGNLIVKQQLEARGYTVNCVGTMIGIGNQNDSTDSTTGVAGEGREGWKITDWTHYTGIKVPVAAGDESTYIANSKLGKSNKHPYLRVATGGDPAGDIRNGYILDFAWGWSRFGVTTPTDVHVCLSRNDVIAYTEPTLSTLITSELDLLLRRIRAVDANIRITVSATQTGVSTQFDDVWRTRDVAAYRAIQSVINNLADSKIKYVPAFAYQPAYLGLPLSETSTTDPVSGFISAAQADQVHPQNSSRAALFSSVAAHVACLAKSLI